MVRRRARRGRTFNFARHLLERQRARAPARPPTSTTTSAITYGELDERVRRMAGGAPRRWALRREERVLLLMHDNIDFPVAFLGALYAGVVPVAVNTLLTADDYAYMLEHCARAGALVSQALLPMLDEAMRPGGARGAARRRVAPGASSTHRGATRFDAARASPRRARSLRAHRPDDIAFWLYSSGSTGRPEGHGAPARATSTGPRSSTASACSACASATSCSPRPSSSSPTASATRSPFRSRSAPRSC